MGRGIILVRHAMPDVARGVSSKLWGITEAAGEDCVLLAHALPADLGARICTSSEKKAEQTAAIIAMRRALVTVVDEGFGEVDRPTTWDDDYRVLAAGYLAGADHPGSEPREAVRRRFASAIDRALNGQATGDIVVVNHGLALSLYLASVASIDLVAFWLSLTFPNAWRMDLETGELARLYSGAPAPDA